MGSHHTKLPIITHPCKTPEEACNELEKILNQKYGNTCIVTIGPDDMNALLSPRTRIPRISLARVQGKEYNVILTKDEGMVTAAVRIKS